MNLMGLLWSRGIHPLFSVETQRACLGRDHSDLLKQLQNVCTQPVFNDLPGFDCSLFQLRVPCSDVLFLSFCCFTMSLLLQARYDDGD